MKFGCNKVEGYFDYMAELKFGKVTSKHLKAIGFHIPKSLPTAIAMTNRKYVQVTIAIDSLTNRKYVQVTIAHNRTNHGSIRSILGLEGNPPKENSSKDNLLHRY